VFIRERGVALDVAEHAVARAEGGQGLLLDCALHLDGLREDVRRIVYAACQHQLPHHLRNSRTFAGGEGRGRHMSGSTRVSKETYYSVKRDLKEGRKTHVRVYTSFVPHQLCSLSIELLSLSLTRARASTLSLSLQCLLLTSTF